MYLNSCVYNSFDLEGSKDYQKQQMPIPQSHHPYLIDVIDSECFDKKWQYVTVSLMATIKDYVFMQKYFNKRKKG